MNKPVRVVGKLIKCNGGGDTCPAADYAKVELAPVDESKLKEGQTVLIPATLVNDNGKLVPWWNTANIVAIVEDEKKEDRSCENCKYEHPFISCDMKCDYFSLWQPKEKEPEEVDWEGMKREFRDVSNEYLHNTFMGKLIDIAKNLSERIGKLEDRKS
jgi:hypothetical protein